MLSFQYELMFRLTGTCSVISWKIILSLLIHREWSSWMYLAGRLCRSNWNLEERPVNAPSIDTSGAPAAKCGENLFVAFVVIWNTALTIHVRQPSIWIRRLMMLRIWSTRMRFLNWDVLLFPDESKVPIQEFDVKCHALALTPGLFILFIQTWWFTNGLSDNLPSLKLTPATESDHVSPLTHIPTLTCFIASLEHGRLFRVSIHSWETPKPSDLLFNFKSIQGRVAFEAKLFIDGHLKAQRFLSELSTWPEVISKIKTEILWQEHTKLC